MFKDMDGEFKMAVFQNLNLCQLLELKHIFLV